LGLTLPVLVDRLDDAVSNALAAWPERIYVVDRLGRIAYVGGPGPFEFDPDAAALALDGEGCCADFFQVLRDAWRAAAK